jgi:SAM-dependent methyltransferase
MGINTFTVAWLSRLRSRQILKPGQSIIEFSPQDVMSSRAAVSHFALKHNSATQAEALIEQIYDGEQFRRNGMAAFYRLFGIEQYRSADLLDDRADWKYDFNVPFRLSEQFDIATNFGTAEHVFNIGNVFLSMHDVLRPGGVALHILPTFGDIDHGFFNIHPTLYLDLAAANDYAIEELCYVDRWDIRDKVFAADFTRDPGFETLPIRLEHLKDRPTLQRMITELFIENYRREDTRRIGQGYPGVFYDYCCVALRKKRDRPFRIPMQGYYGGGAAEDKIGLRQVLASDRKLRELAVKVLPRPVRSFLKAMLSPGKMGRTLSGNLARRARQILPVRVVLKQLDHQATTRLYRAAWLGLAAKATELDRADSAGQLREALECAEDALEKMYAGHSALSLGALDEATLTAVRKAVHGNVWLLEEIAARYLEIHKSDCTLQYERSRARCRAVNDVLSIAIGTDVPMSDEVAASIRAMVDLVRDRLAGLPYPPDYRISTQWGRRLDLAMRVALALRDPRHIAYASMAMFDVGIHVLDDGEAEALAERCRTTYYRLHPELRGIGDSPLARNGTTVMVEGVPYSTKTEQGFAFYHEIFTALPEHERTDVIVEIGSGFGRLARIVRMAGRSKCFVLADLPESLLFAFAFLRVNLPEARTHVISSTADIDPGMASRYDFIFCPIQLLAQLRLDKVDLVINTYSLGEVTQVCADHLIRCIDDVIEPRFLYSLNYMFTDKSIHLDTGGLDGEANEVVLKLKPQWEMLRFDLTPSIGDLGYRVVGGAMLRRTAPRPAQEAAREMTSRASQMAVGSAPWLGEMYFAALWSEDAAIAERFFAGLRHFLADRGIDTRPEFDFDSIGEVKYLRRYLKATA